MIFEFSITKLGVYYSPVRAKVNRQAIYCLYTYICGIARENGLKVLCIGGTDNHIHILLSLNSTTSIAKAIQLIKGGSSKRIHGTFPEQKLFSWQEGYGAFSIGTSNVEETRQ